MKHYSRNRSAYPTVLCLVGLKEFLNESDQVLVMALFHPLKDLSDGVLLEMLAGAMSFQRLRIAILLIDEDGVGIVLNLVRDVADASRFATAFGGQKSDRGRNVGAVFGGELEADGEADHG